MKLYDPTVPAADYDHHRAPPLVSLEGATIGLLSNRKLNADVLLTETARVLQERFGGTVLELQQKNNASAPAPTETLTGLSPECDYLITASGD
ncbi:MAG: hypothetical protein CMQ05_01800 [Gammaproteobacteria bacterium]|nr:hypothetical protein [Gammaproteobacteria bacterium]RPG26618.1 MAG: hypothetical protein CBC10_003590 [Gammaproteobacteria bacterium TMED50]|tara:strand:+ start:975 stop:1253 length:279 start_codon:yes stop_codon:yes gene_type:complete